MLSKFYSPMTVLTWSKYSRKCGLKRIYLQLLYSQA